MHQTDGQQNDGNPITAIEMAFAKRLLYETLHFDEPIEKLAEDSIRTIGFWNGAIENWLRVMTAVDKSALDSTHLENKLPPWVGCPWRNREEFLERDDQLQKWLVGRNREPSDAKKFVLIRGET
jgi:hypothetical protein